MLWSEDPETIRVLSNCKHEMCEVWPSKVRTV